ncbi:DUF1062 domain-containing protein [Nocardiopsis potens]|uniref:DUF1062 domain-containing protein n=1 Tax=Nocardiopsis potens TaxID=1246458 RepID=UPI0003457794|nr:DUF1062 domain-containing protein [Nocardiopsis potens]
MRRTRLPLIGLECAVCPSDRLTIGDGRFRAVSDGRLFSAWLLVDCVACGQTGKLRVHRRVPVRSLPADLLDGYWNDSPSLAVETLLDPSFAQRNRFELDWDGRWELHAPPVLEDQGPLRIAVAFDDPVPVRPERLIAHGLGISRGEVVRRVEADVPLKRRTKQGFSFVLAEPDL